jgi:hypothetical protein
MTWFRIPSGQRLRTLRGDRALEVMDDLCDPGQLIALGHGIHRHVQEGARQLLQRRCHAK